MAKVIVVVEPGSRIRVRKGGVYIESKSNSHVVTPDVEQIIVATSAVAISAKAIRILASWGVDVVFLDSRGYPIARVFPPYINRTVATRVSQYEKAKTAVGAEIAREIVFSKVFNQAQLLRYLAKTYNDGSLREAAYSVDSIATELRTLNANALSRDGIMELEARAARIYWQAIASLLPKELGFRGRDPDSDDVFNMALNYGYGILYTACERELLLAGLDPYLGVLHVEKSGRPSLTLDFVEMFRPIAVDKPIIVNISSLKLSTLNQKLDHDSRRAIASVVLENMAKKYRCADRAKAEELGHSIRRKAWELASCFRDGNRFTGYRVYL